MLNKQQMVRSIEAKLKADRAARDRFLSASFKNKDSFEAKNRQVIAQKYSRLIREAGIRLKALQS